MHTLTGKYNSAKFFTDYIDPSCTDQIMGLQDRRIEGNEKYLLICVIQGYFRKQAQSVI